MKRTVLYNIHKENGAVFSDFHNYILPSFFKGYESTNTNLIECGVVDCSHISTFLIKGVDVPEIIDRYFNTPTIKNRTLSYGTFIDNSKMEIAKSTLYQCHDNTIIVSLNNVKHDALINFISESEFSLYEIVDYRDQIINLKIIGERSEELLARLYGNDLVSDFPESTFIGDFLHNGVLISRENGFNLYFNKDQAIIIWQMILLKGRDLGIRPYGIAELKKLKTF